MNTNHNAALWSIVEDRFLPGNQLEAEHTLSMGNGRIVQRANFEETYSGETMLGSFILPSASASEDFVNQVMRLPNCIRINVRLDTELIDLACCEVKSFRKELNMLKGYIERTFEIITALGHHVEIKVQRFISLSQPELLAINYFVRSLNFNGKISFTPVLDGNFNSIYNTEQESDWNVLQSKTTSEVCHLWIQMRRTNFQICQAMSFEFFKNHSLAKNNPTKIEKQKMAGFSFGVDVKQGESVSVNKYVATLNSSDHPYQELTSRTCDKVIAAKAQGWSNLFEENCQAWEQMWSGTQIELNCESIIREFQRKSGTSNISAK
jgi:Trehalose and maltose hydrolases (possible phosphorylases)